MKVTNKKIRTLLKKTEKGDEKAGERLRKIAEGMSADEWQNWFHGVVKERQRISASREQVVETRLGLDARIERDMTPEQVFAARRITQAVELLSRGLGYKTARLDGGAGSGSVDIEHEWEVRLMADYLDWADAAKRVRIDIQAVISVLVLRHPFASVDAAKRKRKGWAKENLFDALDIFEKRRKGGF